MEKHVASPPTFSGTAPPPPHLAFPLSLPPCGTPGPSLPRPLMAVLNPRPSTRGAALGPDPTRHAAPLFPSPRRCPPAPVQGWGCSPRGEGGAWSLDSAFSKRETRTVLRPPFLPAGPLPSFFGGCRPQNVFDLNTRLKKVWAASNHALTRERRGVKETSTSPSQKQKTATAGQGVKKAVCVF